MKLPKIVNICGKEIPLKEKPKEGGGSFDFRDPLIEIGTKYKIDIPEIFIHEILEAILVERMFRYSLRNIGENGDYLFAFNHEQFNVICSDLANALKDYLEKEG
jgi:hypothetical protein